MQVGVIGLGNIGGHVATNLVADGHDVVVYDVDAERAASIEGARAVASVGDVGAASEVTVLSLPTPAVVRAVADEWATTAATGAVLVDLSTNSPEIVRRLGILSVNTAIEVDITGNVNSTHVLGRSMMNGIGGSGDFARNAFLSIFTCPSTAKVDKISTIVPLVSHLDHSEHSVQVIITDQGVADLRGKSPSERARTIIENCAHPDYRGVLKDYVAIAGHSHSPQTLCAAFGMHTTFSKTGDMRGVKWGDFK